MTANPDSPWTVQQIRKFPLMDPWPTARLLAVPGPRPGPDSSQHRLMHS